ncbi:helix-turn-helix transcriptional regulator [Sediminivirga luteola]|uniref:LuxR family transcriptional regulator n=1 Tax=Sediminivirga luteola TaxID=1774748 RepID=A0A8J2XK72_9MICO|nr:LuxR C-terminal-related transcriptional regulator [Sediminivirga luteola]GGA25803.1 LuxR family transcriptional regulator [Sediminivirga luteola]
MRSNPEHPGGGLQHVPRVSSGLVTRRHLLERLDGPAPIVVLHAGSGTGKTTLLAQWAHQHASAAAGTVAWIAADEGTRTRTGYWMRVLGRLHSCGVIDDATLYREMAAIADEPEAIAATLTRLLAAAGRNLTLILDDFANPAGGSSWDAVCLDLIEIVRAVPAVRCIAAGRYPSLLERPGTAASLDIAVLSEPELELTEHEIRQMLAQHVPGLAPASLQQVAGHPAARRIASLRYAIDALGQALLARDDAGVDIDEVLIAAARQDILARISDPEVLDFVGATAHAPVLDAELAARLTGRHDAEALLTGIEHAGAGQWSHGGPDRAPVFRYSAHLRAAAAQDYARRHPARVRRIHFLIAQWLNDVRGERLAAFEHALRSGDLDYAARVLMRAYPMSAEDNAHVSRLLGSLPALTIHRHPLLALRYALVLNASAETQSRAAEFFTSAGLMSRLRPGALTPLERAIQQSLESAVQRLLGQHKRMRDLALSALPVLTQAVDDPERDEGLDAMTLVSITQCAMGLFYADEPEQSREAHLLAARFAEQLHWRHRRNEAYANLGMIHALAGNVRSARAALAAIDPGDWPETWHDSYTVTPERIARAWVLLSEGRPEEALEETRGILRHIDTIEHWELISSVRALAEVMAGRAQEASSRWEHITGQRRDRRTLPSTHRHIAVTEALLALARGAAPGNDRPGRSRRPAAVSALTALSAAAEGRSDEAVPLLAGAKVEARTPVDRMIAAVVAVRLALSGGIGLDATGPGLRLATIVESDQLRWPLALMPEADRAALLAALTDAGSTGAARILTEACAIVPPMLPDEAPRHPAPPALTSREREVLLVLIETDKRSEIAARLFVSVNTVKAHLRSLYAKLGASSREEALTRALHYGLLRPPSSGHGEDAPEPPRSSLG